MRRLAAVKCILISIVVFFATAAPALSANGLNGRLPEGARMVSLSQDGCSLPDDWYLRVIGKAGEFLRDKKVPPEDLDAVLKP